MAIDPRQRQFNEMQNRMNGMTPGQAMNPNQRRFAEMQNRVGAAQATGMPLNANQRQFAEMQNRAPTMNTLPVQPGTSMQQSNPVPTMGGGLQMGDNMQGQPQQMSNPGGQQMPFMPPPSPYQPDQPMQPMQPMPQQQPMSRRDMEMANRIQGMPKQQMNPQQRKFAEAQNRRPQGILTRPPTR